MTAKPLPLVAFALAALLPVPLMALGAVWGGVWLWAAFFYMAGLSVVLDRLIPHVAGQADAGQEFPAADALLVAVGLSALTVLPLCTWAITGALSGPARVLLFLACGFWLGQVAHPAAHEMIHRSNRWLFRLGVAVYVAILIGHHASAHRLVHHRHVGSDDDPNTAHAGEGFYRFALRAWVGSFREGWRAESALRARASGRKGLHPYAVYLAGSAVALGVGHVLAGWPGVAVWAGLALHAQAQLLVSDYVQHYGLTRARRADGQLEPVGPQHSWNAGQWASSAVMLNAPRHSDHHSHPARPYPALRLVGPDDAPRLPWPLPVACTLAFFPRLFRRAMRAPLARWQTPADRGPFTYP